MAIDRVLCIRLWGYPTFQWSNGLHINIKSKKSIALLALLATAPDLMRSRVWLQQKLWGSRDQHQAQNSLRRELSGLRKLLNLADDTVLVSDHRSVRLNMAHVDVSASLSSDPAAGEFLEGLDIPGAEDFEDWLREMRSYFNDQKIQAVERSASGRGGKVSNVIEAPRVLDGATLSRVNGIEWLRETSRLIEAIAMDPTVSLGYPDSAHVYKEGLGKRYVYESDNQEKYVLSAEVCAEGGVEKYSLKLKSFPSNFTCSFEKNISHDENGFGNSQVISSVLGLIAGLMDVRSMEW